MKMLRDKLEIYIRCIIFFYIIPDPFTGGIFDIFIFAEPFGRGDIKIYYGFFNILNVPEFKQSSRCCDPVKESLNFPGKARIQSDNNVAEL